MKILAFDPGVGNMGWTLLEVHPPKELVTVEAYGTLVGNRFLKYFSKEMRKKFKDNFLILMAYKQIVQEYISRLNPDVVVSEGAFAHKRIAAAFSLVKCIHVIREASYIHLKRDIAVVAPMLTKRTLTGDRMAGKDAIKEAVDNNKLIKLPKDVSTFTEHTYDAIGHGYHYIQTILHPDEYYLTKPKVVKKKKKA